MLDFLAVYLVGSIAELNQVKYHLGPLRAAAPVWNRCRRYDAEGAHRVWCVATNDAIFGVLGDGT